MGYHSELAADQEEQYIPTTEDYGYKVEEIFLVVEVDNENCTSRNLLACTSQKEAEKNRQNLEDLQKAIGRYAYLLDTVPLDLT